MKQTIEQNKKDHGFAFPVFDSRGECLPNGAGLTKHEYAAIMIAQGMVSTEPTISDLSVSDWKNREELIAIRAAQLATSVLKESSLTS